jgi:hypothetical protein
MKYKRKHRIDGGTLFSVRIHIESGVSELSYIAQLDIENSFKQGWHHLREK